MLVSLNKDKVTVWRPDRTTHSTGWGYKIIALKKQAFDFLVVG
jgi:hypothetical protein